MSRGWRWFTNGGIAQAENPFNSRHCVPLAFANVSSTRRKARFAAELADAARVRVYGLDGQHLLNPGGGAPARSHVQWALLARYAIVETFEPEVHYQEREDSTGRSRNGYVVRRVGRPTLAQFARSHRSGRWIVYTEAHAQAVVAGKIRGWASPRQRVRYAVRVEEVSFDVH